MNQDKIQANNYEIQNTYMGKIPYNSDLLEQINNFCIENKIQCGNVNVIGAVQKAEIGYYSQDKQEYEIIKDEALTKGLEIVSCTGNISLKNSIPFAHLHIVLSNSKGSTYGGHLMPGTIIYAGEFIIHKFKGNELKRAFDEKTKLPLWEMEK
ncbi:MAG: PPC domain-containing DNA-binding protein [Bacillota bacterium]